MATVIPVASHSVHGALYRISPSDEAALDQMEGVPRGWYYKDQLTVQHEGEAALMYVATAKYGLENQPNRKYLNRILEGYRDWGLPTEALEQLECYSEDERLES